MYSLCDVTLSSQRLREAMSNTLPPCSSRRVFPLLHKLHRVSALFFPPFCTSPRKTCSQQVCGSALPRRQKLPLAASSYVPYRNNKSLSLPLGASLSPSEAQRPSRIMEESSEYSSWPPGDRRVRPTRRTSQFLGVAVRLRFRRVASRRQATNNCD